MASDTRPGAVRFRVKVWPVFLVQALTLQCLSVFLVTGYGLFYDRSIPEPAWYGRISVFATVVSVSATLDQVLRYRVVVSHRGIDGFNGVGEFLIVHMFRLVPYSRRFDWFAGTGVAMFAPWGAVRTVRRYSLFGLPYLRVRCVGRTTDHEMFVPLYLVARDEFAECVADYAGPDHPLTAALDTELDLD